MYPHLQQCLVSIWGAYAWKALPNYRIENNFHIGKNRFRGRPLTEHNLQVIFIDNNHTLALVYFVI